MSGRPASESITDVFPPDEAPGSTDKDARMVGEFLVDRGSPLPLGPDKTSRGMNLAVFSRHATAMTLELFHDDVSPRVASIPLDPRLNRTGDVWHVRIRHDDPGHLLSLRYLWRADGPRDSVRGHFFDPSKPLLDPCARALSAGGRWGRPDGAAAGIVPRRCLAGPVSRFDWEGDCPLLTPIENTVIYELHLRGFTVHPSAGISRPGTFIGLTEKIPYLRDLGVTAVELMPVFEFDENENMRRHPETGGPLLNFWGYSPLAFYCPNTKYSANPADGGATREFKEMVKRFHQAGIEVYLDVVFNHTAEGDGRGPTVSFRGLDNAVYYMMEKGGGYRNYSGCGNTFNCNHPVVRSFILDVLRYWVAFMHVDGFRFDLASVLGRGPDGEVLSNPPLLEHIALDPVLARTKLIAEAWDAGGLNQVGEFPAYGRWAEWNGYFRDEMRRFWRGDGGLVSKVATRFCGSDDLYGKSGRRPTHSINFVTAHDGFTLNDLVSYSRKHNEDNGEGGRDGEEHNHSMNFGVEGPTDDRNVLGLRRRQAKNFVASLLLSQGVPMILGGDEFLRTQRGNNNAYCQDNEIGWVDWTLAERNADMLRFVRLMIRFRREHPVLMRTRFFGQSGEIVWHGEREGCPDWSDGAHWLSFLLDGAKTGREDGSREDDMFVMINASDGWRRFFVPARGRDWRRVVDTSRDSPEDIFAEARMAPVIGRQHNDYALEPKSLVVLVNPR